MGATLGGDGLRVKSGMKVSTNGKLTSFLLDPWYGSRGFREWEDELTPPPNLVASTG